MYWYHRLRAYAQEAPETLAATDSSRALSYGDLADLAARVAQALRAQGVGPANTVGIACASPTGALVGAIGALAVGAVVVPIDPRLATARAQHILDDSRAVALIADAQQQLAFEGPRIGLDELP